VGLADPGKAWIFSNVPEGKKRWPAGPSKRAKRYGGPEFPAILPLHYSPGQRAGQSWSFACKAAVRLREPADLGFLQLVANQVAVAIENAIAFPGDRGAEETKPRQRERLPGGGSPHRAQLRADHWR